MPVFCPLHLTMLVLEQRPGLPHTFLPGALLWALSFPHFFLSRVAQHRHHQPLRVRSPGEQAAASEPEFPARSCLMMNGPMVRVPASVYAGVGVCRRGCVQAWACAGMGVSAGVGVSADVGVCAGVGVSVGVSAGVGVYPQGSKPWC